MSGHLYWDIERMWDEIQLGVARGLVHGRAIRSISVDSWAVDYVPLDTNGVPLRRPYSYRDPRTTGRMERAIELAGGREALYDRTGIQFLSLNTLPQVIADIEDEPELARRTATRLLIAEYFLYRLSGQQVAEATNASTTQLVDVRTRRVVARADQGDRRRRVAVAAHRAAGHGARTAAAGARAGRREQRADGARVLRARHRVGRRRGAGERRARRGRSSARGPGRSSGWSFARRC